MYIKKKKKVVQAYLIIYISSLGYQDLFMAWKSSRFEMDIWAWGSLSWGRSYMREFQLSSVLHLEPTKITNAFKTSKFGPIATLPAILEFILPINSYFWVLWVIQEWPWKETCVAKSSNYRKQDMKYSSKLDNKWFLTKWEYGVLPGSK